MAEKKNESVGVDVAKASPVEAVEPTEVPAVMGATFADRAAARNKGSKQVGGDDAENKAVKSSESKSRRRSAK